ncbi:MAG: hypothetical protein WBC29_01910 [Candidatus Moraniibacteriota bacterium]
MVHLESLIDLYTRLLPWERWLSVVRRHVRQMQNAVVSVIAELSTPATRAAENRIVSFALWDSIEEV